MLMIIAHHYVVNSGLTSLESPMMSNPTSIKTLYLWSFGMWGKTGINCFLMITGYFMCKSKITLRKFVKLFSEICFYKVVLFGIFALFGYMHSLRDFICLMPIWGLGNDFIGCFVVFWLTIPFWNILIHNMNKKQHERLLILLLLFYTLLGSIPKFHVTFNYVTWFGIIYLISSYIRFYPNKIFENKQFWGIISLLSILMGIISMYVMVRLFGGRLGQYFVADSNKIFAVTTAVSSFLWFKNIKLPYLKAINLLGASTFGVLLIHAHSNMMRNWLWCEVVDCVGHYQLPLSSLVLYSLIVVISIFSVCVVIDMIRVQFIEKPFLRWYDLKIKKIQWLNL